VESASNHDDTNHAPVKPVDSIARFAGDVLRSAAYTAIVSPVLGVTQLFSTRLASDEQRLFNALGMQAPEHDASGARWLAQTLGSAAVAVPLYFISKPVKAAMANEARVGIMSQRTALGLSLQESAVTGFIHGSIFTPGDPDNLLASRTLTGLSG